MKIGSWEADNREGLLFVSKEKKQERDKKGKYKKGVGQNILLSRRVYQVALAISTEGRTRSYLPYLQLFLPMYYIKSLYFLAENGVESVMQRKIR